MYAITGEAVQYTLNGVPVAGSWPGAYGPGKTFGLFLGMRRGMERGPFYYYSCSSC
jgi:hypothetical protein